MVEDLLTEEQKVTTFKEMPTIRDRFDFTFGRIDEVLADALVCPQDSSFSGKSLEAELLQNKYGSNPFTEARERYREYIDGLQRIGEKGVKNLPIGFARATQVGGNDLGIRKIVHVNVDSGVGQTTEVLREAVSHSLREASLDPEVRTVAVPFIGEITPESLRKYIPAIARGVRQHFELTPDSGVEKVLLVVNADDNEVNRTQIEEILSSVK
ncbi:hypothetical protein A2715_02440 [Candidatus Woesebacteria bacterium RIFCSPHIGHO2_01_FULL_39_32]|nr:MAG: hypothetical protein A2715_02440 [Candidatus Woesebacteria bacterium RIFCSPHIGHO2_01_FULL_39_32]